MSSSRQRIEGADSSINRNSSSALFSACLWHAVGLQPKSLRISRGLFFSEAPADCCSLQDSRDPTERQAVASCREDQKVRIQEFQHHKRQRASSGKAAEVQFLYADDFEPNYEALSMYPRRQRTGKRRGTSSLNVIAEDLGLGKMLTLSARLDQSATDLPNSGQQEIQLRPNHPNTVADSASEHQEIVTCSPHASCDEESVIPSTSMDYEAAVPQKVFGLLHKEHPEHADSDWGGPPGTSSGNSSQDAFAVYETASPLPSPIRDERSSESVKLPPSWSPTSDPMSEDA